MHDIILKRFEESDELREFEKGRFEVIHFDSMTIGRATYEPGWKWSVDVSPLTDTDFCEVEHLGMVLEGHATCRSKTARCTPLARAICSTSAPSRTTAGSWVTRSTSHCTSKAPTSTLTESLSRIGNA